MKMQYHPGGTTSFFTYAKDVRWKGRSKWQWYDTLIMAIVTLHVLCWPTWMSAMTGYQPIDMPLLRLNDGSTFIAFSDIARCTFVIQDGKRVGLKPNACVGTGSNYYPALQKCELHSALG